MKLKYIIKFSKNAVRMLKQINDLRIRKNIVKKIEQLQIEPEKQGKPLGGELGGFYVVRAVGQRYRIIFKIEKSILTVFVVAAGLRKEGDKKDVYKLARKLFRSRLLD